MPDDRKFITQEAEKWPFRPILPVKRPRKQLGSWPETGIILEGALTRVLKEDIFSLPKTKEEMIKCLRQANAYEYETVDALLEDGWIVD